jgi:hypothetical protein
MTNILSSHGVKFALLGAQLFAAEIGRSTFLERASRLGLRAAKPPRAPTNSWPSPLTGLHGGVTKS